MGNHPWRSTWIILLIGCTVCGTSGSTVDLRVAVPAAGSFVCIDQSIVVNFSVALSCDDSTLCSVLLSREKSHVVLDSQSIPPNVSQGSVTFDGHSRTGNYSVQAFIANRTVGVPVFFEIVEGRIDACGVCKGDNTSCVGCDGVPRSGKVFDACGVCGGIVQDESVYLGLVTSQLCEGDSIRAVWRASCASEISLEIGLFDPSRGGTLALNTSVVRIPASAHVNGTIDVVHAAVAGNYTVRLLSVSAVASVNVVVLPGLRDSCGVCGGGRTDARMCLESCAIPYSISLLSNSTLCKDEVLTVAWTAPCDHGSEDFLRIVTADGPSWRPAPGTHFEGYLASGTNGSLAVTSLPTLPPGESSGAFFVMYVFGGSSSVVVTPSSLRVPFTIVSSSVDACGICGGDNSTCSGCDGVPHSGAVVDSCGICGGGDPSCGFPYLLSVTPNMCRGSSPLVLWSAPRTHSAYDSILLSRISAPQLPIENLPVPTGVSGRLMFVPVSPGNYSLQYQSFLESESAIVVRFTSYFFVETDVSDACGVCGGNNQSCSGCDNVPNSGLVVDVCGVCGGTNLSCAGCDGVPFSGTIRDACGVCGGDGTSCRVCGPGSTMRVDACGVCGGDNSTCAGCDGVPHSSVEFDDCGVCGGRNESCAGCDGIPWSNQTLDVCGICGGTNSSCGPYSVWVDAEVCWHQTAAAHWIAPRERGGVELLVLSSSSSLSKTWHVPESGPRHGTVMLHTNPSLSPGTYQLNFTVDRLSVSSTFFVVSRYPADECGICGGDGTSCKGCDGIVNSGKVVDMCGVCGGLNVSCSGCDGVPNSGKSEDICGVCGGDNTTCTGCDGVPLSVATVDSCGVCGGSDSRCQGLYGVLLLSPSCVGQPFHVLWWAENGHSEDDWVGVVESSVGQTDVVLRFKLIESARRSGIVTLGGISNPANISVVYVRSAEGSYSAEDGPYSVGVGIVDACGVCGGDNSTCRGCDGIPLSGKVLDGCGVCGGTNSTCGGCDSIPYSGTTIDACGVCGGDNMTCVGCDGRPNSGKVVDACGKCGGNNHSCSGCDGVLHSATVVDACGVCGGDNVSCAGCDGVPHSGKHFDLCGVCGGDSESCSSYYLRVLNAVVCFESPFQILYHTPSSAPVPFYLQVFRDCVVGPGCVGGAPLQSVAIAVAGSGSYGRLSSGRFNGKFLVVMVVDGRIRVNVSMTVLPQPADPCDVCGGDGSTCAGCDGVPNSGKILDGCGVCGGANETCGGCDGLAYSGTTDDACGVCGGDNSTCRGCDGVPNSGLVVDTCGVCGGSDYSCDGRNRLIIDGTVFCEQNDLINLAWWLAAPAPVANDYYIEIIKLSDGPEVIQDWSFVGGDGSAHGVWSESTLNFQPGRYIGRLFNSSSPEFVATSGEFFVSRGLKNACGDCGGYLSCAGCDGVPNSGKVVDGCGICGGRNASCGGCDGVAYSTTTFDACGVCGGDNSTCSGCDGVLHSGVVRDACGTCNGTDNSCAWPVTVTVSDVYCVDSPVSIEWLGPSNHSASMWISVFCSSGCPSVLQNYPVLSRKRLAIGLSSGSLVFGTLESFVSQHSLNYSVLSFEARVYSREPSALDLGTPVASSPEFSVGDPVDACGVCGGDSSTCLDCAGVPFGGAQVDICGQCCGGSTAATCNASCSGCDGIPFSGVLLDGCGVCGGDNSTCRGCDGVLNSGLVYDSCGVCNGTDYHCGDPYEISILDPVCRAGEFRVAWKAPSNHSEQTKLCFLETNSSTALPANLQYRRACSRLLGRNGVASFNFPDTTVQYFSMGFFDSTALARFSAVHISVVDACGVCGGNGSSCAGCDGVPNSHATIDTCGVCGGDCQWECDACGVCGGDGSSCSVDLSVNGSRNSLGQYCGVGNMQVEWSSSITHPNGVVGFFESNAGATPVGTFGTLPNDATRGRFHAVADLVVPEELPAGRYEFRFFDRTPLLATAVPAARSVSFYVVNNCSDTTSSGWLDESSMQIMLAAAISIGAIIFVCAVAIFIKKRCRRRSLSYVSNSRLERFRRLSEETTGNDVGIDMAELQRRSGRGASRSTSRRSTGKAGRASGGVRPSSPTVAVLESSFDSGASVADTSVGKGRSALVEASDEGFSDFVSGGPAPSPRSSSTKVYDNEGLVVLLDADVPEDTPETVHVIATFVNSLPSPLSNFKCKAAVLKVGTGSAFSLTSPYVIDQYLRMEMGGPSASTVPANQEGVVSQSFTIVNTMHGKKPVKLRLKLSYDEGERHRQVNVDCVDFIR